MSSCAGVGLIAGIDQQDHHDDGQQDHGDSRAKRPVTGLPLELFLDKRADHEILGAAEQVRRKEGAEAGDKTRIQPAMIPGFTDGMTTLNSVVQRPYRDQRQLPKGQSYTAQSRHRSAIP